jgi:hypothetical protein
MMYAMLCNKTFMVGGSHGCIFKDVFHGGALRLKAKEIANCTHQCALKQLCFRAFRTSWYPTSFSMVDDQMGSKGKYKQKRQ